MDNNVFESEQYFGELDEVLKKALKGKPTIFRLTGQKNRIYFTKADENAPVTIYNSGTTILRNYNDEAGNLAIHKWKVGLVNSGKDPAIELVKRQNYGTLLHILYGRILMGEKTSFSELKNFIISCAEEARIDKDEVKKLVNTHMWEFEKDVASFLTWIKEYKVRPLGIELMLKSDKYKVATALDLICEITAMEKGFHGEVYKSASKATGAKAGDPKMTLGEVKKNVIVDFKSGKKGFYDKNILQLLESRVIFEENFPDIKIDGIYNFAPNDWKTKPTYKFYDQERESKQIDYLKKIFENVMERGKTEFEEKLMKRRERVMLGDIDINNIQDELIQDMTLEEMANKYYREKYVVNRDVFGDFLEESKDDITDTEGLVYVLERCNEEYLQELANGVGITYNNQEDFIKQLVSKYEVEYGEK